MTISQIKSDLQSLSSMAFQLPDGNFVPGHFHITEVGKVTKHFIDCGGTVRKKEVANFQLWEANDYDHRLHPEKFINIIELSEKVLHLPDLEIEVEYQMSDTIGKFRAYFQLTSKQTNCLAQDKCGLPAEKLKVKIGEGKTTPTCCTSSSNCC